MDHDTLNKDDKVARTEIDVSEIFTNPGAWSVDEKYPMTFLDAKKFPEGSPQPEIYIQAKFVTDKMLETSDVGAPQPAIKYNLAEEI